MHHRGIIIRGAREHNLKGFDLFIPRDRLVVITGLSGSGKSSLAFDTLYAEGQRRYVESLSAYARQFLEQMDKPDVDAIEGLSPAIAIEQKSVAKNPRSTVGTVTEIYDYLRLLFARAGKPYCYKCGHPIISQSVSQIVERVIALPPGEKFMVLAPVVRGKKGEHRHIFEHLIANGFVRVRVDGSIKEILEVKGLEKNRHHTIDVIVDRLINRPGIRTRLADSIETALHIGNGLVQIVTLRGEEEMFSQNLACMECGISYPEISPRFFSFNSPYGACPECDGLGIKYKKDGFFITCPVCQGSRLRPETLGIKIAQKTIAQINCMTIRDAQGFFSRLDFESREKVIAGRILKEIQERLAFLSYVGLDYLSLDRTSSTLSGGESMRIRLATQIGSSLMGVLYILDEPTIGLHQKDNIKLLETLKRLRDQGNTVLVVEHDRETICEADYVIDLGPGAGEKGGELVAVGSPKDIISNPRSLTGRYLAGLKHIPVRSSRRHPDKGFLIIRQATQHNLKGIDVKIPLGVFVCVTGVSGAGKSSLIMEILYPALAAYFYKSKQKPGSHKKIEGIGALDKVVEIDQSPIGRTPRSNPATYTGTFTHIRKLFSMVPESRMRGYQLGRFSFNIKGGRCEACEGDGLIKIEMHFLPDIYIKCDICKGKRYNNETLEIRYKGKNISDILDMTVEEALKFFSPLPALKTKLQTMADVGLGYIKLGQSATTLSGGEAQRIKLSKELSRKGTGRTIYILDEPTTGLHFADIERLVQVLNKLVDLGNTVLVIEHNMDIIKTADYIIDLGPEGGEAGGYLVAEGTPEEVSRKPGSATGEYLKKVLTNSNSNFGKIT